MRVLYDHQIFQYQRFGGISRYYFELFRQFNRNADIEIILPFSYSNNEYLLNLKDTFNVSNPVFLGNSTFPGKDRLHRMRNKYFPLFDPAVLNRNSALDYIRNGNYDIIHPTYYDVYYLDAIKNKKLVLTIYDLIYEKYFDSFPSVEAIQILENKKKLIDRSDHIIVLSESGKKDLLSIYNVDPKKVSVIHLGNSLEPIIRERTREKPIDLPNKYILFVGNRFGYKNFSFFIETIQNIIRSDKDLYVVCTGKEFTQEEFHLLQKLKIHSKVIQRYVPDNELIELYQYATMFVFPSLYEGFGIPVLEAMSNGCPTLLSNTSSLPEVGGDASVYFDPTNASSIATQVSRCLYDDKILSELTEKGLERVKQFSWKSTAAATVEVYRKVLNN